MSSKPAVYNLSIQKGADYKRSFQFRDGSGAPIDLSGASFYAQAWNAEKTIKYADFNINYVNRLNGQIQLVLPVAQTEVLPPESHWDLLFVDSLGFKQYYIEGLIYTSEGYSSDS